MARQARVIEEVEPPAEPHTETITYTPGPMDPSTVKWGGHVFQANIGKELTGHAEGTPREKLNHQMIESARTNKHFFVGSNRPKRVAASLPTTAQEYRAYMVEWLKDPEIEHAEQLIARFARDHELQTTCEVGTDDFAYLSTLLVPKLHELARSDELNELQVATLWASHGINQLPWSH